MTDAVAGDAPSDAGDAAAGAPAEELYREPGRGFASTAFFLVLLAAGFALDSALGGATTHLPGWIVAAVLVVGVDLLTIYASRVSKTLTVTTDELRIGDEVIARDEVIAAQEGVDPELPVLGWQGGMPRGRKAVTVRLDGERAAVVPTRRPSRVLALLAVEGIDDDAAASIREAEPDEYDLLAEIDERAETVFRVAGYPLPELEIADFADAAAVFVIGDPVVGFVRLDVVDATAHLTEVALLPGSMKQGLGARLIERACEWGRAQGHPSITLTTYVDVPWNGPVYARRGWVELGDPGPELLALRAAEAENGLDAVGRRIAMIKQL